MSLGPTVLRSRAIPFPAVAALVLACFFLIQAIIVDRWMAALSLGVAALFVIGGSWVWLTSRNSAVLIDANQFIVKRGRKQQVYDTADIETVNLAAIGGHVRFADGRTLSLPLQGNELVEAGLLLTPRGRRP